MSVHRDKVSVFSDQWYRVEQLVPKLANDITITRQVGRGQTHFVIARENHRGQLRLNQAAFDVIGRCDGRHSLAAIWETLARDAPDLLPPQALLLDILARLVRTGIVDCPAWPDLAMRRGDHDEDARKAAWQRRNPFAPRLRLMDPTKTVALATRLTRWVFEPIGGLLTLALAIAAMVVIGNEYLTLRAAATTWLADPRFWVLSWAVYPVIKFIHEIGHGVMLHRYGGRTPELGVALLMGLPAPYIDASDGSGFARRRERFFVSAAGILTELAIAAIALLIWAMLEPGLARDIAFVTALTGSLSTLLFNANPLVRLDGYHALSDALDLPNLAQRSAALWHRLACRGLGLNIDVAPTAAGERFWLVAYAPAAWCWRVGIMVWLAFWLGDVSRLLGLSVLAVATILLVAVPVIRLLRTIRDSAGEADQALGAGMRLGGVVAITTLTALLPMPDRLLATGYVVPAEAAQVRALRSGFIPSEPTTNTPIQMTDPALDTEMTAQQMRLDALQGEWLDALTREPTQTRALEAQLDQARRRLDHLQRNRTELKLTHSMDARFATLVAPEDLAGRFVMAGELIGVLRGAERARVELMLDDSQAARVRRALDQADHGAAIAGRIWSPVLSDTANNSTTPFSARRHVVDARIIGLSPTALASLASPALSRAAGGPVATEPVGTNTAGPGPNNATAASALRPVAPVWQLEMMIEAAPVNLIAGSRVVAGLDLGWQPLGLQLVRSIGQSINTGMNASWF